MCHSSKKRQALELADILKRHAERYIKTYGASVFQKKAIRAISRCRTAELGGHVLCCNHCGAKEIAYNSCRYRHCPKCQTAKQLRWVTARQSELLPVPYYHVVFTLPHELNPVASYHPEIIYQLLFKAAWATIETLGYDKKRLNGKMGMLGFLHTWGQNLNQHIHLHCMIPGGALSQTDEGVKWNPSQNKYLFPVRVMSKLFGKLFRSELEKAYQNQAFRFKGCIADLSSPMHFAKFQEKLAQKSWNVYAKAPFNGAEGGIEYLGRYFAKTAIGNERILSADDKHVRFKWRDYADNNQSKIMKLTVDEFIRRYLSHILPDGFMRVRYFGFLASSCKKKNLETIQFLLNSTPKKHMQSKAKIPKVQETLTELIQRVIGIDIEQCKRCRVGRLQVIEELKPILSDAPKINDTS
ncbi:MAG: IS91 family transposase [Gammaproteobacteria bacterium]|nr:IS91 family transposase [Gammaproteobacteria bacterium]